MPVNLTDDEIVATCGLLGLAWPYPLPTVDSQGGELAAASRRGVRSLTVRGLLGVDPGTNEPGLDADVAAAVSGVATGSPQLVSGVLDAHGVLRASGSAACVVQAPDGSGVLATTTATGIHVISTSTVDEARDAFIALVDNALSVGLAGDESARLLVVKAGEPDRALAVSKGVVTVGRVGEDAGFTEVAPTSSEWNRALLNQHLAA